jgi:LPS-assembly protein
MPSLSYPLRNSWGFFIPKVSYLASEYEQENQITNEVTNISRELPVSSLDMGLFFDRGLSLFNKNYTHSLIPRLFYVYIPYREQQQIALFDTNLSSNGFQQLWRENRFSGIDRIGDANHVSIAITNALKDNQSGQQVVDFVIGRKYYIDDSLVSLGRDIVVNNSDSPWLAEVNFRLNDSLKLSSFIEWDETLDRSNEARSSIKYEPKDNHIVNLSHRYRDIAGRVAEESDFSFAWPVSKKWRLLGRWYRDLDSKQTIDSFLGVEYESCCWAIRFTAQRYLNTALSPSGEPIQLNDGRYNEGFNLQFIFKGVGSAGQSGLGEFLESNIDGYDDPFLK